MSLLKLTDDVMREMTAGFTFKVGNNDVTYIEECELTEDDSEIEDRFWEFKSQGNTFSLEDFERTWDYVTFRHFDGVLFGTAESGWLIKMTDDQEGLYVFRF